MTPGGHICWETPKILKRAGSYGTHFRHCIEMKTAYNIWLNVLTGSSGNEVHI